MDTTDLRYPIGKFQFPEVVSAGDRRRFIDEIAEAPARLRAVVAGLSEAQLETPYRPGGWTVRQVVHHVPDSHLNSYVRYRLALTEDDPVIKPYAEDRWALLSDARTAPVEVSLQLLESLHQRWVALLASLGEEEWWRTFRHPELGPVRLDQNAALYAWHGRHHVAHITALRERMGWK
ncbi:MAG TPA: putative metal-dependent hydrolase [Bryobacteraceae bacterium]|nr:putative metal-dependent hydrolase [Bryobacteraceae bacterium]